MQEEMAKLKISGKFYFIDYYSNYR